MERKQICGQNGGVELTNSGMELTQLILSKMGPQRYASVVLSVLSPDPFSIFKEMPKAGLDNVVSTFRF
jgi:hypothetical protein